MLNCNRFEYKRCRYQKPQEVKNNSFLGATISHHVRKFGESMPHRPTMQIAVGPQSGVKKQTISTKILTMRSALLHCSENYRYLFGLLIEIYFSVFARVCF